MPSTISLVPSPEDLLNPAVPYKYNVEELATYSTHEEDVQGNTENHPDLQNPLPTFQQPVASRSVDSQDSPAQSNAQQDEQQKGEDSGLRILAIPGRFPINSYLFHLNIEAKLHFAAHLPKIYPLLMSAAPLFQLQLPILTAVTSSFYYAFSYQPSTLALRLSDGWCLIPRL